MNLDVWGLPQQADGDRNDQLQRVGMVVAAHHMGGKQFGPWVIIRFIFALEGNDRLQPVPGVYSRYTGAPTNNVSADQLIAALCAWVALKDSKQIVWMALRCLSRLGFAQNTRDGLDGSIPQKWKVPDFMLLRALPLFARTSKYLYPFTLLCDAWLILLALSGVGPVFEDGSSIPKRHGPGDVDDNNTTLTLLTCLERMPTPLSKLAWWIFKTYRPWNLGCVGQKTDSSGLVYMDSNAHHPVIGALRWYHRAESGGNPEIGEALIQIVRRHL